MLDQLINAGVGFVRNVGHAIVNHVINSNRPSEKKSSGNSLSAAGMKENKPDENEIRERGRDEQYAQKRRDEAIKPLRGHIEKDSPISAGASKEATEKVRKVMARIDRDIASKGAWTPQLTDSVKKFQTKYNEQRKKDGKPLILVDGRVGRETVDAFEETLKKKDSEFVEICASARKESAKILSDVRTGTTGESSSSINHPVENAFNGVANFQRWLNPVGSLVTELGGKMMQSSIDNHKAINDAIDQTPFGIVDQLLGGGIRRTIVNNLASNGQTQEQTNTRAPKSKLEQIEEKLQRLKQMVESDGAKFEVNKETGKIKITMDSNIQFEQDNDALSGNAMRVTGSIGYTVNQLATMMPNHTLGVNVSGHASTEGDADHNMNLSRRRAQNAAQDMQKFIHQPDIKVNVEAHGETKPLEGVNGEDPRNRRVEIEIDFSSLIEDEKKKEETKPTGGGGLLAVYREVPANNGLLLTTKP